LIVENLDGSIYSVGSEEINLVGNIPKGVEVYHRGIVPLVEETRDILGMVETDQAILMGIATFQDYVEK